MKKVAVSILVVVLAIPFLFNFSALCQEDITLTTYYPSPHGVYQELRSKRMAIGDNYINSNYGWSSTAANPIDADADLVVEGNIGVGTIAPNTKLDVDGEIKAGNTGLACSGTIAGALRYNNTDNQIEYCNGNSWVSAGGGGGPTFIAPVKIHEGGHLNRWITYDASGHVPEGATAVILVTAAPYRDVSKGTGSYKIRKDSTSSFYQLMSPGIQGTFPISSNRTFEYAHGVVSSGWIPAIYLIGYF
jgi:hypothetical protein